MAQKLVFGVIGGAGIVAVLFVMGIVLSVFKLPLGTFAIGAAVFFAVILAALGVFGIVKRLFS